MDLFLCMQLINLFFNIPVLFFICETTFSLTRNLGEKDIANIVCHISSVYLVYLCKINSMCEVLFKETEHGKNENIF